MIFVFPCLTYFTKHNALECYPCCHNGQLSFFLMPRILILYAQVLHISHILIHSFIDGHLCCFCILAIENNAAMSIGSIYLFELVFLSSLDKHPEVELLDHMVAHIICNLHTVFLSGCTNFHSTNNTQSFSFSTSSHVVFWITGVLTGMSDISLRF